MLMNDKSMFDRYCMIGRSVIPVISAQLFISNCQTTNIDEVCVGAKFFARANAP